MKDKLELTPQQYDKTLEAVLRLRDYALSFPRAETPDVDYSFRLFLGLAQELYGVSDRKIVKFLNQLVLLLQDVRLEPDELRYLGSPWHDYAADCFAKYFSVV